MLFTEFPKPWGLSIEGHSIIVSAANGRIIFSISDLQGESLMLLPEWALLEIIDLVNNH